MENGSVAATGTTASTMAVSAIMFGLSVIVTVAFGYFMFADPARLTMVWQWVRALPLLVQLVMWLILLPWMIALWVWNTTLALGLRIAIVGVLLVGAEMALFPWKR